MGQRHCALSRRLLPERLKGCVVHQVRLRAGKPLRDVAGEKEMERVVVNIQPLLEAGRVPDAILVSSLQGPTVGQPVSSIA